MNAACRYPQAAPEAASLFDSSVEHWLKFHADTMALTGRMLAADPHFVMGHCFKGCLLLSASNPAFRAEVVSTLAAAEAGAPVVTERERQHVAAFAAWAGGALDRSFGIWQQLLDAYRTDLLAARICDTSWFGHGQTAKSWSRPIAWRRAGRPHCRATTCSVRSGPSPMRRRVTRPVPKSPSTKQLSTTAPTILPTTSRRM
jgi:hypothetical protein